MADPDASVPKRPRLDSGNPSYNGQFAPLPPPHSQQPALVQAISPSSSRHYPSQGLPPPSPSFPAQGQVSYQGSQPQPSPSLPPSDIRTLADPRTIPSPGQRAHGIAGHAPVTTSQDRASNYRAPPTPQSAIAPEHPSSRSNSISHDIKSQSLVPNMDPNNPPSPWNMNPDHRSNGSASNGYGHTISPPHANGPLFHPPSHPPAQQYAQPANMYSQGSYVDYTAAGPIRRKQVRATQACNHCRSRKQKCDEARPCQFCRENNFDCQYKDVPPPKQDRSMMQLQESVNNAVGLLKSFMKDMSEWRQSVDSRLAPSRGMEAPSDHASPETSFAAPMRDPSSLRWPTPAQGSNQLRRFSNMKMESPTVSTSNIMSPINPQVSTPIKQELSIGGLHQPATPAESIRTDRSRASDSSAREKSGLQSDHTTPAHKLLAQWQSMHTFYKDIDYLTKLVESGHEVSDYAMQLEQDRGLIRVWGVGEGQDANDGAQGPGSPESSNDSDITSPAPGRDTLWGHPPHDRSSPSTASSETLRDSPACDGGLGADGRPNFASKVMEDLLTSYLENMHNLHPFLNPSKLRRMVKEFSDQYSPDIKSASAKSPANTGLQFQLHQGVKRKRSSSIYGEPSTPRGSIERSLRNAIVLLVLALGKVCSYKDTLPAPQSDKNLGGNGVWGYSRGSPHPSGSFSSDNGEDHRPRNIDFLPGMAYFSYATDILGNQQGGNTVAHAQAMILAALYLSQFARVLESWSWIHNACRVTMVLIKKDYPQLVRKFYSEKGSRSLTAKERYRLNLVMCVYWTCLQLESDILAEMSTLPPSLISKHQNDIMYPEVVVEYDKFNDLPQDPAPPGTDLSMLAYSSQIWLRVVLNEAHNALYGANGRMSFDTSNVREVANHATIHIDILESWRQVMPAALAWKDDEPPSTDLNLARVRAKYYGGLYMMLRPYLLIAIQTLEFPPAPYQSQYESPAYLGEYDSVPRRNEMMVDMNDDQRRVIQIACKCIESAIQSTIAFDRVGAEPGSPYEGYRCTRQRRLVLTNIFGTLHAQFGNMLVLVSVYKSKIYHLLPSNTPLNKPNLTALLSRTIDLLQEIAPNSPTLKMDLEILYNVRKQNGLM